MLFAEVISYSKKHVARSNLMYRLNTCRSLLEGIAEAAPLPVLYSYITHFCAFCFPHKPLILECGPFGYALPRLSPWLSNKSLYFWY